MIYQSILLELCVMEEKTRSIFVVDRKKKQDYEIHKKDYD